MLACGREGTSSGMLITGHTRRGCRGYPQQPLILKEGEPIFQSAYEKENYKIIFWLNYFILLVYSQNVLKSCSACKEFMNKIKSFYESRDVFDSCLLYTSSEVLADQIVLGETRGYEKEWNINSEKVTMAVEKV